MNTATSPSLHHLQSGVVAIDSRASAIEVVAPTPTPTLMRHIIPWSDAFSAGESELWWVLLAYADHARHGFLALHLSNILLGALGIQAEDFNIKSLCPRQLPTHLQIPTRA